MADGKIVAHNRDWINWDIWGSAEAEYCCGLCEGRIPYSEIEGVIFLDQPEVNFRIIRKNVFLDSNHSVVTVSVRVPEDKDDHHYEDNSREALTTAAEDLGNPSQIIHSYVQDFSIEE